MRSVRLPTRGLNMTHEGRMSRGQEKLSRGITDSETQYFLDNQPKDKTIPKVKDQTKGDKKDAKPSS